MIVKKELKSVIEAVPLSTIFSWFEAGDMPTEYEFKQTFSSFRHVDGKISRDEIAGLEEAFHEKLSAEIFADHLKDENAHQSFLAKRNASNLTVKNIEEWKEKLKIDLAATIDGPEETGNVYTKEQINEITEVFRAKDNDLLKHIERIDQILVSDDVDLDELQEIVNYIKRNREQIEWLKELINEGSSDDKIKIVGIYSNWGEIPYQNRFNDTVYDKIQTIEETARSEKIKYEEMIKGDRTIKHNLETLSFMLDAYDIVTLYTVPVKVRRIDLNTIEVLFDSLPPNMIQLTIKKI